ncbi:NAD-dependent epimerase/dehydratase family protein [Crocosphaera sp.]|uniref:NAD-dependent epimerase/dehydratase family protein n=1 Tax=Crocosphaera sp. TaxID=2729996 RepID=UPI002606CCE6|nr:NAD-dependent epimerase/dehydratase family protein [Crocosphaera sp.]MDJ0578514.1 NAD-dependent epimerase/dehydratase family protein [Crocosphaera sp.]
MVSQRILITGAAGFIGSHLLFRLRKENYHIAVATRKNSSQFPDHVTVLNVGDIDGFTNWKKALKNIDIVIHLAGRAHILNEQNYNPEAEFLKVNVEGTKNLVNQSIQVGVKHFIFMSSIGAMTTLSNQPLTENSLCNPDTSYGKSKLKAEENLIELASQSSMSYTILRPNLVYGKGNPGNMERLVKLIKKEKPLPFGLIKNNRSFIYVGNLVDSIVTCITHPQARNQIFLVSDGQDISTPELIKQIAQNLHCRCQLLPISPTILKWLGYFGDIIESITGKSAPVNSSTIERLLGSLIVDSSKIREILNWQPPYTIEQGLKETFID